MAVIGLLGIYAELVWPGRFAPGLLGAGALVWGSYVLWRDSAGGLGAALVVAAVLLFLAESFWNTYFVSGALGTASLAAGACILVEKPPGIAPEVAIPASILCGGVTTFLGYAAKQGRVKKWSDIRDS